MKNFFLFIHLTNLFFKSRHVRLKSHKKNTPGKRRVNQNKTHRKGEKWRAGVLNVGLSHRIRVDQLREKSRPGVLFDRGSNPFESINSCIFFERLLLLLSSFFFLLSSSSSSLFRRFRPPTGQRDLRVVVVRSISSKRVVNGRNDVHTRRTSTRIGFFFFSSFFSRRRRRGKKRETKKKETQNHIFCCC